MDMPMPMPHTPPPMPGAEEQKSGSKLGKAEFMIKIVVILIAAAVFFPKTRVEGNEGAEYQSPVMCMGVDLLHIRNECGQPDMVRMMFFDLNIFESQASTDQKPDGCNVSEGTPFKCFGIPVKRAES